ncbi:putative hemolysin [Parabacteroides sp. PFB2-10]|uniref:lysophospholipid acyltransferase family protein n=1 Tax=Parabacteroides sp. PFB2-10 TaxID=1742405 RepID=UPI00247577F7|nr:lysophospholipid acyltransferase family protein [Parabacteroides sp. PFB2-10]MDH6312278.1 putative hemolysin [Parabacteroides sp. PFB2-10]MDL2244741.1 lysophospholipid acyltransferase family protein [Parabacteroides sp. OttesenSCG-928-J18]
MKKTVIDIYDLQEMVPFFKSTFGTFLGKIFLKWFKINKVNRVHANSCHLRGADFTSALLNDPLIDLHYKVHNEELLKDLPEGAFVTVSNHPIGSLDGIILIDLFAKYRPDFKVMVNGFLTRIGAMEDNFISVVPESSKQDENAPVNINGVRLSLQRLKEGHPMGFFPAGAVSMYNEEKKKIVDLSWTHSVIRLIRKSKVPIYPVLFDFLNTRFFYWLGTIDWRIRTLRMPAEAFNKRGRTVDVYLGEPITPEQIQDMTDEEVADFLYQNTYGAKK